MYALPLTPSTGLRAGEPAPRASAERLVADAATALLGAVVAIGDRNGLFRALSASGPVTPETLARRTGQSARYLAEWLSALACAGYVTDDRASGHFELPPAVAAAFSDAAVPSSVDGLFALLPVLSALAPAVADAFHRGTGVPHSEFGAAFHEAFDRFSAPQIRRHLVSEWIPAVAGLETRLHSGGAIGDVGCGCATAVLTMASAYPDCRLTGYDCSPDALAIARARLRAEHLSERVPLVLGDAAEGLGKRHDLICALYTISGLVDPVGVLAAIRESLLRDGVLLWAELDVGDDLADTLATRPLLGQIAYSVSLLYSLTVSLGNGGMGLGAALGEPRAAPLARRAGFGTFRRLPVAHPFTTVYEVRP